MMAVANSGPEDPAAMSVAPATSGGRLNAEKGEIVTEGQVPNIESIMKLSLSLSLPPSGRQAINERARALSFAAAALY